MLVLIIQNRSVSITCVNVLENYMYMYTSVKSCIASYMYMYCMCTYMYMYVHRILRFSCRGACVCVCVESVWISLEIIQELANLLHRSSTLSWTRGHCTRVWWTSVRHTGSRYCRMECWLEGSSQTHGWASQPLTQR